MLCSLSIRDFALIGKVDLSFSSGLTILVGETGAGKSIVIEALSVALGERTSADIVRSGARKAVVEATFDIQADQHILQILKENELEWDAEELLVRREVSSAGSTRCFVNDIPTTAAVVRELSGYLLDFHGQHDTHGLLNVHRHRELLDGILPSSDLLASMHVAWQALLNARGHLTELQQLAAQASHVRDRCEYIKRHIGSVQPIPGEQQTLEEDLRRYEAREHILEAASQSRTALVDADESAQSQISRAIALLTDLQRFDDRLSAYVQELESALTACKEAASAVAMYADADDYNPEMVEQMRQRLSSLQRLAREYGSIEDAIRQLQESEQQLADLQNIDDSLKQAAHKVEDCTHAAMTIAQQLHEHRTKAAAKLSPQLSKALHGMGMPSAVVDVQVRPADLNRYGMDTVEFLFSANAGEVPSPLQKIASGGELSRFMLAVKSAQSADRSVGTLVFDEIDTGISGRVARKVGEVIKTIGRHSQVICITHLPQIASLADNMIRVVKTETDSTTSVTAQSLDNDEVVTEVARLLSGDQITEGALLGARELMGQ